MGIPWSVLQYTPSDNDFIPFDIEILVADPSGIFLFYSLFLYYFILFTLPNIYIYYNKYYKYI